MKHVAEEYRQADLSAAEVEMCADAEKLTKTPYKMIEKDIKKH